MRIDKSKKSLRESEEISVSNVKPFADVQIGDRAVDYAGNVGEVLAKGTAEEMLAYDTTGAMEDALSSGYVDFATDAIAFEIESDGSIYAIVYGSDGAWVETGMDNSRVYSFAFDFVINEAGLSPDEARDRILRDIELVDGISIVGNPNTDPTSWSREEYGLAESTKKDLNEGESAESKFVDLNDALDFDDDVLLVKLPTESTYAGKYLVYSISSRGAWIAKGVIVDKKPEDLLSFNPFEDKEEIEAEGYKVFATFTSEGNSYLDPVIFEIAENESFIDLCGDGDNPILGEYFGADVNDYLTKVSASDDDDWDDDDDELEEENTVLK